MDRLCFGTSTFAAGRLRPDKDSEPGIAALRAAVRAGVRLVHSNPKLGTQWAVRRALDSANSPPDVRHLIKAEAPLHPDPATLRPYLLRAIEESCRNLGINQIHALTVEIDLKRTHDRAVLADLGAVRRFYAIATEVARQSGRVDSVIAYCHSPAHLTAVLDSADVHGVAAQYNLVEPWPALFLERIAGAGMDFVGMSPLNRGRLAGATVAGVPATRPLAAVSWAAADPRVSAIVTTMSCTQHLRQVISAMREPLPATSVQAVARTWQDVP